MVPQEEGCRRRRRGEEEVREGGREVRQAFAGRGVSLQFAKARGSHVGRGRIGHCRISKQGCYSSKVRVILVVTELSEGCTCVFEGAEVGGMGGCISMLSLHTLFHPLLSFPAPNLCTLLVTRKPTTHFFFFPPFPSLSLSL